MATIPTAKPRHRRRLNHHGASRGPVIALALVLSLISNDRVPAQTSAAQKKQWFRLPVVLSGPAGDASRTAECGIEYGPTRPVTGLAFSPDGKRLAAGGSREVLLWNLESGTLGKRLGAGEFSNAVRTVAFTDAGRGIAAGDGARARFGAVRWIDVGSGRVTASLTGPRDEILSLTISPDGRWLAGGSADHTAYVWDLRTKTLVTNLAAHSGWVTAVAFSPDGRHLATAGSDRKTCLWTVDDWSLLSKVTLRESVLAAVFSPDGAFVAFGCGGPNECGVRLRRMEDLFRPTTNASPVGPRRVLPPLRSWKTGLAIPSALAWNRVPVGPQSPATPPPQRGRLYAACSDASLKVFHPGGKPFTNLLAHSNWVTSVVVSDDGRRLASGGADGAVKLWDPVRNRLVATLIQARPGTDRWVFLTDLGYFNASSPDEVAWKPPGPNTTADDLNRRFLNPEAVRVALNALRPPGPRPGPGAGDTKGAAADRTAMPPR